MGSSRGLSMTLPRCQVQSSLSRVAGAALLRGLASVCERMRAFVQTVQEPREGHLTKDSSPGAPIRTYGIVESIVDI